jgi:hypothetical protein
MLELPVVTFKINPDGIVVRVQERASRYCDSDRIEGASVPYTKGRRTKLSTLCDTNRRGRGAVMKASGRSHTRQAETSGIAVDRSAGHGHNAPPCEDTRESLPKTKRRHRTRGPLAAVAKA